ncbi:MAG: T3SS effector HopA1 family protein [Chitinophagaceae bacterium]
MKKSTSNTTYITGILEAIDISPQRVLTHHGKPYGQPLSNAYIQQPSTRMLFQSLEGLLYAVYYSRNNISQEQMQTPPSYPELEQSLRRLSASNRSTEGFDEGWTIENIDLQGQIMARKGNLKRQVFAGEFISTSMFHQRPLLHAGIKLISRREHKDPGAGFYYVFSNTAGEDNPGQLVRIYFNIKPEGAPVLIEQCTTILNELQVPFSFKCLQHPFYYTRCDTAVLYFDKRYSPVVFEALKEIHASVRSYLQPDCPAFTRVLAPGVAFAENPLKAEESFGTHCSKMIAQGIMNAYTKGLPRQEWLNEIRITIEQKHKYASMDLLYLNPETNYPYSFPELY